MSRSLRWRRLAPIAAAAAAGAVAVSIFAAPVWLAALIGGAIAGVLAALLRDSPRRNE